MNYDDDGDVCDGGGDVCYVCVASGNVTHAADYDFDFDFFGCYRDRTSSTIRPWSSILY